jgi:hypothetical protein
MRLTKWDGAKCLCIDCFASKGFSTQAQPRRECLPRRLLAGQDGRARGMEFCAKLYEPCRFGGR